MFRVEQEIKTEKSQSFVQTRDGFAAVGKLRLLKAIGGSLQLYAFDKQGKILANLFVIDKQAGEEFLRAINEAWWAESVKDRDIVEDDLTKQKNTDLYNGDRSASQEALRPKCPKCGDQMPENIDGEWFCDCDDVDRVD